jgi:protein TonB
MLTRFATAGVAAVAVTVGVLLMMQALIATGKQELDETGARHFVDFVRVEREEISQRKERRAEKPPVPEAPPPDMPQPRTDTVEPTDVGVSIPSAPVEADLSIGGLGLVASDGEYLPIIKIAPVYPWKAQSAGIEGYCIVEYTVTASGTVKDVIVVDADPKGIFEKASIEAALKFKYKPRVVNGQPIDVRGVRNLFRYRLESR